MNQAHTTYQADYTPLDWLQNNFISDMNEFCSADNIDECLKYISQEFCALGYPSIYSNTSDCPFAVNCDIVKFLNVTFELLRRCNEQTQMKEDLEDRNQRLSADLNVLSKKNANLKNALEQNERKLASALERERQLKQKNEQLSQSLKTEKEETKKLTAQVRQQKVAHQHEVRKYENNMNQIKAKVNQLLSDKNPNKKITNISISHTLPRNAGQRGKWKTDSTATSAIEDMYNSIISSYETRCKDMYKELKSFQQCLQSVLLQMVEIVSNLKDDVDGKICFTTSDEFVLNEIKSEKNSHLVFEEKFKYLFSILKEAATRKAAESNKNLENQIDALKSKISEYEKFLENCKESQKVDESQKCIGNTDAGIDKEEIIKSIAADYIKKERLKLNEEKEAFFKSLEKEKAEISSQKLAVLRLAMQQKTSPSTWHHSLNTVPSISVITYRSGASRISSTGQLKSSFSSDQAGQLFSSERTTQEIIADKTLHSKSDSSLLTENKVITQSALCSKVPADLKFSNSDLPSWATKRTEVLTIVDDTPNTPCKSSQNDISIDSELPSESSSEEINMRRLRAAIQDIEQRRTNIS